MDHFRKLRISKIVKDTHICWRHYLLCIDINLFETWLIVINWTVLSIYVTTFMLPITQLFTCNIVLNNPSYVPDSDPTTHQATRRNTIVADDSVTHNLLVCDKMRRLVIQNIFSVPFSNDLFSFCSVCILSTFTLNFDAVLSDPFTVLPRKLL